MWFLPLWKAGWCLQPLFPSLAFWSLNIHSFIHSHASLVCEPKRLRVRLRGVCAWRASAARSRCACRGACGDTTLFRARGHCVSEPSVQRGHGHTPTLRVDTHPPQEVQHTQHTTQSLLPLLAPTFPGGEAYQEISGLHSSAQSAYAPPLGSLWDPELRRT